MGKRRQKVIGLGILAFLLASCTSKPGIYTPDSHRKGGNARATCYDGVLGGTPPKCADIGWCEVQGYGFPAYPEDWCME